MIKHSLLIIFLATCVLLLQMFWSPNQIILVAQTAKTSSSLDQSDRQAAFVTAAMLRYLDDHNQKLTIRVGTKTTLGQYTHTPTQSDLKRLKKTLRLKPYQCREIQNNHVCSYKERVTFRPVHPYN